MKPIDLNDREKGKRVFIIGSSPQLNSICDEEINALENEVTIAVNRVQYKLKPKYFISAYPSEILLALKRSSSATIIHIRPLLESLFSDQANVITIKRELFDPLIGLPRFLNSNEPTLFTKFNVALASTHLALILGAKEIIYIGIEMQQVTPYAKHYYDFDPAILKLIFDDIKEIKDYRYFNIDHSYATYEYYLERLGRPISQLNYQAFRPENHVDSFRTYFKIIKDYGINIISTKKESVIYDAGASYTPLAQLLTMEHDPKHHKIEKNFNVTNNSYKTDQIKKEIIAELLYSRLLKADISTNALISVFTDPNIPVSMQEIEMLHENAQQARNDGADLLADTLEKLVNITIQSQSQNEKLQIENITHSQDKTNPYSESNSNLSSKNGSTLNQPVIIAGMHRSGTSMVTQVLKSAGVYLGADEDLLGPSPDNEKGHLENLCFLSINERILTLFGGGWDYPPHFSEGWENSPVLDSLKIDAINLISHFKKYPFWGWKDPRNTILIPFWKSLLPNAKIILCLRNPIEVAKSLYKRNYFSYAASWNLWLQYYETWIRTLTDENYIITHYDAWFHNPTAELERLLNYISMSIPEALINSACSEISLKLRHDNSNLNQLIIEKAPIEVLTTYWKLCQKSGPVYKIIFTEETIELDLEKQCYYPNNFISNNQIIKGNYLNNNLTLKNIPDNTLDEIQSFQKEELLQRINELSVSYTDLKKKYENINIKYDELEKDYISIQQLEHENINALQFAKELTKELILLINYFLSQLHNHNQYLFEYEFIKNILSKTLNISSVNFRLPIYFLCINVLQKIGETKSKDKLLDELKQIMCYSDNATIKNSILNFISTVDRKEKSLNDANDAFNKIFQSNDLQYEIENNKHLVTPELIDILRQKAIHAEFEGNTELSKELSELADLLPTFEESKQPEIQIDKVANFEEEVYFTTLFNTLFRNPTDGNQCRPLLLEPINPPRTNYIHTEPIDIIICVHNAIEDVKRCLFSVINQTNKPYNLIIIDDGSDQSTQDFLMNFASKYDNCKLIRNDIARGYTRAANEGMRISNAKFLVLLNSDTIVGSDWLDRLYSTMIINKKNGIVSPLSNTASWQSIPKLVENGDWAKNNLPDGLDAETMSQLVAKYSAKLNLNVPLLNGFCLMIRREVINQIGLFNEDIFGDGYGEEDDFNIRARETGWNLAIADDVYIYHAQSKSYSNKKRYQLSEKSGIKLRELHGDDVINKSINIMNPNRVLEGIRARTNIMFEIEQYIKIGKEKFSGKRVLFILPVSSVGGGANVVIDEARCMKNMGVDVNLFNVSSFKEGFLHSYPHLDIPTIFEKQDKLANIAAQFDAAIATANFSVEWLKPLENRDKPILGYYIQDFEPLMYTPESIEAKKALKTYNLIKNIRSFTKTQWTQQTIQKYNGSLPENIGISINIDLFRPRDVRLFGEKPIKIVAMVRAESKYRNPEITLKILSKIKKEFNQNVIIQIFGTADIRYTNYPFPLDFQFEQYGILTQLQVANLLSTADIFVDFSTHQAMGLTALEAMACGAAVIVPQNGGAIEFVKDSNNGLIADTTSFDDCYQKLKLLVLEDSLRTNIQLHAIHDVTQYYPEKAAYNILNYLFEEPKRLSSKQQSKTRKTNHHTV